MPESQNNTNSARLDQETALQMHDLCNKLYDQVISIEELAELNRLLNNAPAARQFYLRYVSLHGLLLGSVGRHQQFESELLGRHIDSVETEDASRSEVSGTFSIDSVDDGDRGQSGLPSFVPSPVPAFGIGLPSIGIAILIVLSFAAMATIWLVRGTGDQFAGTERHSAARSVTAEKHLPTTRVSYISPAARWQTKSDTPSSGDSLGHGDIVNLADGEVELTYHSGTKLLLIGPAEFLINDTGGKLVRGGLVASVTKAGHGFTIDVPNGKVVDLGTEFGVAVDDFGVSEVSVFEGKVKAFPAIGTDNGQKIELLKGDGLQWNRGEVTPLDADLRRFATSALGRQIVLSSSDDRASCVDRFRAAALDANKWKSLGDVDASPDGLVMKGTGVSSNRPYLISAQQFNPLMGPVTVTCDFQFSEFSPEGSAAFSIMTRGADERGVAPEPWNGLIASCVSCSFGSEEDSRDGWLQAGVKLESDRETVNVSRSGFEPPAADTRYRAVMRDDGVNVSFTVSLLEQPSVSKTVTCRSLFNGKSNHVAMESSVSGSTIVERVEIAQDRSAASLSNYAEFCSLLREDPAQQEVLRQQLASLAPEGATLILQDDFSGATLDSQKWKSLGEIVLEGGIAQIGKPNAAAHIDTWKARPYLLTRDILNTDGGTLTITGKISFADNFLDGYGASFAVMTRADDERGSGPGWENSVLQRGVRANFWPASFDKEHSLEIHEKPTSNTITLLATRGAEVHPLARLYLFRVVDDGESITLTIVDSNKPEDELTITSPTTSDLKQGFVGFESCWGSPITLDEVRIFQSIQPQPESPVPVDDK